MLSPAHFQSNYLLTEIVKKVHTKSLHLSRVDGDEHMFAIHPTPSFSPRITPRPDQEEEAAVVAVEVISFTIF